MSLICKIFGHKWEYELTISEVGVFERKKKVYLVQREFCARCGRHNPASLSNQFNDNPTPLPSTRPN